MAELIDILYIEAGKTPRKVTIDNNLKTFQELVGGYIEAVYPYDDDVAVIVNEEGKMMNLPYSRALRTDEGKIADIIAGPMLIVGLTPDRFTGLDKDMMEKYEALYHDPEIFVREGYRMVVHKTEEFDLDKLEELVREHEYDNGGERT